MVTGPGVSAARADDGREGSLPSALLAADAATVAAAQLPLSATLAEGVEVGSLVGPAQVAAQVELATEEHGAARRHGSTSMPRRRALPPGDEAVASSAASALAEAASEAAAAAEAAAKAADGIDEEELVAMIARAGIATGMATLAAASDECRRPESAALDSM